MPEKLSYYRPNPNNPSGEPVRYFEPDYQTLRKIREEKKLNKEAPKEKAH